MWRIAKKWVFGVLLFVVLTPIICVAGLRWLNPPTSSIMLQNNIHALLSGTQEFAEYRWLGWNQISGHIAVAIIAAEDQRFPNHFGIDFLELRKAFNASAEQRRGASTITQQVAKNLFLWSKRSYIRKGLEAGLAILIEILWSKQRILEVYLNIAQMGENLFGVAAASARYYNKQPLQLNRYEAARIAAILPNPSTYSALQPSNFVIKRQQWILGQMKQLGGLSFLRQIK